MYKGDARYNLLGHEEFVVTDYGHFIEIFDGILSNVRHRICTHYLFTFYCRVIYFNYPF